MFWYTNVHDVEITTETFPHLGIAYEVQRDVFPGKDARRAVGGRKEIRVVFREVAAGRLRSFVGSYDTSSLHFIKFSV